MCWEDEILTDLLTFTLLEELYLGLGWVVAHLLPFDHLVKKHELIDIVIILWEQFTLQEASPHLRFEEVVCEEGPGILVGFLDEGLWVKTLVDEGKVDVLVIDEHIVVLEYLYKIFQKELSDIVDFTPLHSLMF